MQASGASLASTHAYAAAPRWARARSSALLVFALASLLVWILHIGHGIRSYPFDASIYWNLALAPDNVAASSAFRGYLFLWLLRTVVDLGALVGASPVSSYRFFSSLLYAATLTLVIPSAYARMSGRTAKPIHRLAPAVLVMLVFPGVLLYPLSDFPALAFMWLCLWSVFRCADASTRGQAVGYALLAGAAAAAAYNTRTIYLFAVALVVIGALWQFRGRRYLVACAALGFALTCAPQMLLNHRNHGVASPDPTAGRKDSLFLDQLKWGIWMQKYETSVSPEVPNGSVVYVDQAGLKLMPILCREAPMASMGDYLAAVLRHPIDFMGLYARHLVNGIDVRDRTVYVKRASGGETLASVASITLVLLLLLALKVAARSPASDAVRSRWPTGRVYALAILLPSIAILPGAVETRFMLPMLLLLFVAGVTVWSWPDMRAELRRHPVGYLLLGLLIYSSYFAVTQNTMGSVQYAAPAVSCPPPGPHP